LKDKQMKEIYDRVFSNQIITSLNLSGNYNFYWKKIYIWNIWN